MQVGRIDVDRLLQELTTEQLKEWMAYEMLEPFGQPAEELRFGGLSALTANINRNSKVRSEPFTPDDFMYDYESVLTGKRAPTNQPKSAKELYEKVSAVMSIFTR